MLLRTGILVGFLVNHNRHSLPWFFVSVASKGLSFAVPLLTLDAGVYQASFPRLRIVEL
jgi:hypothetical protein